MSNFIKFRPLGVELFVADRQTDMKLTVAFPNSANSSLRVTAGI